MNPLGGFKKDQGVWVGGESLQVARRFPRLAREEALKSKAVGGQS